MEILGLLWIPDFVIWILVLVAALYIYGTWTYNTLSKYGYKGPQPKPFFGNNDLSFEQGHVGAWDLTGKGIYGKTFALYEGRQPVVMSFDTDFLKQVLVKEFSKFTDRRDLYLRGKVRYSLLDLHGEEWKRVRNILTPFFTSGKLRRNTEVLKFAVENLMTTWNEKATNEETINAKDMISAYTLEAICLTAFGLEIDSQKNPDHVLLRTCKSMISDISPTNWVFKFTYVVPFMLRVLDKLGLEMWPKGAIDTLTEFTRLAIDERQKGNKERPDFIQAMIQALEKEVEHETAGSTDRGKGLTEDEIVAQVSLFVLAGYDTVSTTSSFLLYQLANNPVCQDRLLLEINDVIGDEELTYELLKKTTYLDMCLEESQRLYPSLYRYDRMCTQSTTINGHYIPEGTLVIVPVYGLHHDPEYWTDPEVFDPDRFSPENRKTIDPYAYHAFGVGPRSCIGMRLAEIEVKMAVIKIIQNFRIKVAERTRDPLKLDMGFFTKVEDGIWLNIEKR